jgi:hypothetical protein
MPSKACCPCVDFGRFFGYLCDASMHSGRRTRLWADCASMKVACALVLLLPLAASALDLTGKVVAIADGDTLTPLVDKTQHRIRIDGIEPKAAITSEPELLRGRR